MEREMDLIRPGLAILFTGFNPSIQSGRTGHHYANPTNRFWKILHHAGLTDRLYRPEEDRSLLHMGYGFTNIVHRPTKDAAEITKEEYAEGRAELIEKIGKYRPKAVCFVGKGVYLQYSRRKKAPWGFQEERLFDDVQEFAAPSSSGLVRIKIGEIVAIYQVLAEAMRKRD